MEARRLHALAPELQQRFAAARVRAAHQAPYLASALLALEPVVVLFDDDEHPELTAFPADDRWHIYLESSVLEATEVQEISFWMLHQVAHLLRSHAERFPERKQHDDRDPLPARRPEQRRWNAATDAEIDDDLVADDLDVPERAVKPETFGLSDDRTGEHYWDELSSAAGDTKRDGTAMAYDCGSGCDGQPRLWDCHWPGLSAAQRRRCQRETARRIRDHVRQRGDVPLGWRRWADEILEPTVDWRQQLAAQIRRGAAEVAGRVDFTYRRPSRRQAVSPDVILPSLRQPLPKVAVVIDTSGSMSDGMLGQAVGEVGGVLRSVGVGRRDLRVICCDAQAYEAQFVRELVRVELPGGGGTDMSRGLQAAAALRPAPDVIVVLTDGYTPWPAAPPPKTRVVVGLMDEQGATPDWADVVLVGEGAR